VLAVGEDPRAALAPGAREAWERRGARFLALAPEEDAEGVLARWLARHDARAVILRPDRYVLTTLPRRLGRR
jgi:hypothetical protein